MTMKGELHTVEPITQADLTLIAQYQEAEWLAQTALRDAIDRLERRIADKAEILAGSLYWNSRLRMVRSRKKENAGDANDPKKKEGHG